MNFSNPYSWIPLSLPEISQEVELSESELFAIVSVAKIAVAHQDTGHEEEHLHAQLGVQDWGEGQVVKHLTGINMLNASSNSIPFWCSTGWNTFNGTNQLAELRKSSQDIF